VPGHNMLVQDLQWKLSFFAHQHHRCSQSLSCTTGRPYQISYLYEVNGRNSDYPAHQQSNEADYCLWFCLFVCVSVCLSAQ